MHLTIIICTEASVRNLTNIIFWQTFISTKLISLYEIHLKISQFIFCKVQTAETLNLQWFRRIQFNFVSLFFSCPPQNQVLVEGQCCKTCQADFCSRGPRDCHPELAVCVNGLQNYTCHCKQGFKGDGKYCEGMVTKLWLTDWSQ